jgi:DNA-binding NarL/FixJ family response regulator
VAVQRVRKAAAASPLSALTAKEREALVLFAQGYTMKEIADKVSVSQTAIRARFECVNDKLGTRRTVQAVAVFVVEGMAEELLRAGLDETLLRRAQAFLF